MTERSHIHFMKLALAEAEAAFQEDEIPVGALLLTEDGTILASAHNRTITLSDPTAHAEILALRFAAQKILNYRLLNTTLYVTNEPCIMCMGAIIHSRVKRVVYGSRDPKWGAAGSLYDFTKDNRLNHKPDVIAGICEMECRQIIQRFFQNKRSR